MTMPVKRILTIDDDVLVLKTLRLLLGRNGFEVESAKDGYEGLAKLAATHYDLIICDIRMPQLNGVDLIKKWRLEKVDKSAETPVIFITGYADEDISKAAIELKVDGYILKPFDLDLVMESVKNALT